MYNVLGDLRQRRPSPKAMMHFPLFQISPLFSKNFWTFWKISKIFPFPEKISHFHPPKISDDFFFSHRPQISDSPLFFLFQYMYFPPYFDHDAFMYASPNAGTGRPCLWYQSHYCNTNRQLQRSIVVYISSVYFNAKSEKLYFLREWDLMISYMY